jgi:hypothetical protein
MVVVASHIPRLLRCSTLLLSILTPSLLLSHSVPVAKAEDSGTVVVSVRTIQASEPIKGASAPQGAASSPKMPTELKDIEGKLAQLPFSSFMLLASKSETHTLKKREMMRLPNGQTLTLRPMYMDDKRVGLWLNWRDADNSEILNTRVHFDSDDAVVTGTDFPDNRGLILAIKASAAAPTGAAAPAGK